MNDSILIVTETMGVDGPERVISELTKQWVNSGYNITIVLTRANFRKATYSLPDSVCIVKTDAYEKGGLLARINEIIQVRRILKDNRNAVCVSLMISTSFSLAMASIGLKNRIILSERNDPSKVPFTKFQRKLRDFSFEFADQIVFQTQDAMDYFPKRIRDKGTIIFNPVNPDLPLIYNGERKKTFVAAGRLHPQKNFGMLIESFARFSKESPEYDLIIFGEGPDRDKLQKLIDEKGMSNKISMPGFSNNVNLRMVDCAAYISSSDYEGMSNSMLEALAMGVPTICTDCPIGGARQIIDDGVNGILVPVNDSYKMYKAMKKITENQEFTDNISKEAYKTKDILCVQKISDSWLRFIGLDKINE